MTTLNDSHINWDKEFNSLMKLKGQKTSDMDRLLGISFLATVNCPEPMQRKFDMLYYEITKRSEMLDRINLGL